MANIDLSLDPVDSITVDAIGKPGSRVFYIQGKKDTHIVTLIIEKVQLQSLIMGVNDFMEEISTRFHKDPQMEVDLQEEAMLIHPPVEPLFRVGDMGLAYDESGDMVCIIAKETPADTPEAEGGVVRYWCTRAQLLALANWAVVVIERGRPICPQCGQPMEPEGHFCPKKNGHKKNDPV
ncbi:MAG: hypothetical protein PWQ55_2254 [Chloroflexota bacterium]|nr:hypothetical protein [Chloroflexota bacterium]